MRTKINSFNNIHNSLVHNHTRRSGSSDLVDIMTAGHSEYKLYHGHPFTMIPSWELLRNLQSGILYHRLTQRPIGQNGPDQQRLANHPSTMLVLLLT
ncbi:hypothetical protein Hanom_Chr07g00659801 [Helianthus anomalus]